jgi:predicted CXXCH cytochrome family protein
LRDEEQALCLDCHNQPQQASDGHVIPDMTPVLVNARFLHGPIRVGNCSACHYTHASRYTMLLRNYFPREFYEAFHLEDYALCFTCHSESTVLEGESSSFTGFRDGSTNLHFVHVNRQDKGRTCRTCHEIHGSNLTKHMASTVPFEGGGWAMPIRIQQTETGGRCSPGCHEPREYGRLPQQSDSPAIFTPENENTEAGQP